MNHDHLLFGHFADGVAGAFFAEAAVLQATVGYQVGSPLRPPIDVQVACVDFAGEAERPVDVLREDARREAVVRAVREREGLVEAGEGSHLRTT